MKVYCLGQDLYISFLQDTRQLFYHLNNRVNWEQCGRMIQFQCTRYIPKLSFVYLKELLKGLRIPLFFTSFMSFLGLLPPQDVMFAPLFVFV